MRLLSPHSIFKFLSRVAFLILHEELAGNELPSLPDVVVLRSSQTLRDCSHIRKLRTRDSNQRQRESREARCPETCFRRLFMLFRPTQDICIAVDLASSPIAPSDQPSRTASRKPRMLACQCTWGNGQAKTWKPLKKSTTESEKPS